MSALMIWLDTKQAKFFHLKPQTIHVESIHYHGHIHPVETLGKNHPVEQTDEERFYRQLSRALEENTSSKWLLMGPGLAPKHFVEHLKKHQPQLAAKVIGVQKVEHLPDADILSIGRKFLHQYYLFSGT